MMSQTIRIPASKLFPRAFFKLCSHIDKDRFTHYILKGGRGSCKSSSLAIMLIMMLMRNPGCHATVFRRYAVNLAGSVYNRLLWAIGILGLSAEWKRRRSPLELEHRLTGNRIIFLGGDEPEKIKSITPESGYFKYTWFEEYAEFACEEDIRNILQSLMRGGDKFGVFYSYNPPKSVNNWANATTRSALVNSDTFVHHSTYLDVPEKWLGKQFRLEALKLKNDKPVSYRHEYMGEETGTGGAIFDNVIQRPITDDEIKSFEYIYPGLDLGFTTNPSAYVECSYSKSLKRLYIFHEVYKAGLSNEDLADAIKARKHGKMTIADSEDPRTIAELKKLGVKIDGAKKGPDSVDHGMKWLQKRYEIIIDPVRCPNTAREFQGYEYEQDRLGNFKAQYPDKNNHAISGARYAMEKTMLGDRKVHLYA